MCNDHGCTMQNCAQLVDGFMKTYGQPTMQGWGDPVGLQLGMNLIREECEELDVEVQRLIKAYHAPRDCDHNLIRSHFAKELGDLLFVVYWMARKVGIDVDSAMFSIWQSNLSKLGPDGKPLYRADGKVLKGPNYFEPDMMPIVSKVPCEA